MPPITTRCFQVRGDGLVTPECPQEYRVVVGSAGRTALTDQSNAASPTPCRLAWPGPMLPRGRNHVATRRRIASRVRRGTS